MLVVYLKLECPAIFGEESQVLFIYLFLSQVLFKNKVKQNMFIFFQLFYFSLHFLLDYLYFYC